MNEVTQMNSRGIRIPVHIAGRYTGENSLPEGGIFTELILDRAGLSRILTAAIAERAYKNPYHDISRGIAIIGADIIASISNLSLEQLDGVYVDSGDRFVYEQYNIILDGNSKGIIIMPIPKGFVRESQIHISERGMLARGYMQGVVNHVAKRGRELHWSTEEWKMAWEACVEMIATGLGVEAPLARVAILYESPEEMKDNYYKEISHGISKS